MQNSVISSMQVHSQHSGIRTSGMRSLNQVHTRGSQNLKNGGAPEKFSNALAEPFIAAGMDEFN